MKWETENKFKLGYKRLRGMKNDAQRTYSEDDYHYREINDTKFSFL